MEIEQEEWHTQPSLISLPFVWFSSFFLPPGFRFNPAMSSSSTSLTSVPIIPISWPSLTPRPQHWHWQAWYGRPSYPDASSLSGRHAAMVTINMRRYSVKKVVSLHFFKRKKKNKKTKALKSTLPFVSITFLSSVHQARVSLPGGLAMHSMPGRQVCIDTGLPPFFHMPPPAHAHAPAPSSPQPLPSPHSSHTHKVGAGYHKHTVKADLSLTETQKLTLFPFHILLFLLH